MTMSRHQEMNYQFIKSRKLLKSIFSAVQPIVGFEAADIYIVESNSADNQRITSHDFERVGKSRRISCQVGRARINHHKIIRLGILPREKISQGCIRYIVEHVISWQRVDFG